MPNMRTSHAIEGGASVLQKASRENGVGPIWGVPGKSCTPPKPRNVSTKLVDGAACQGLHSAATSQEDWAAECISQPKTEIRPEIERIHDSIWGMAGSEITPNLLEIN